MLLFIRFENLSAEVVEPFVDVPVEPLLLLLDQLGQLRLRQLPVLLIPVWHSVFSFNVCFGMYLCDN